MNGSFHYLLTHPEIQLWLFGSTLVGLWSAEAWLRDDTLVDKGWHSGFNALFALMALPVQLVMSSLCVALSHWTGHQHWGLVYLFPNPEHPLIKFVLMFVLLDFLDYCYHMSMHHVPAFWRFHRAHHSDRHVDVSTTVREHPGETLIRNAYLLLWVFLCGASIEVLILRQTVETFINQWSHSAIRLPGFAGRLLGLFLVTPNFHHIHHHARLPHTDSNFGDVFTLWDRLFGTMSRLPDDELVFGLEEAHPVAALPGLVEDWSEASTVSESQRA